MEKNTIEKVKTEIPKLMCGIVMPISELDGCSELHWKEIYSIVNQSVEKANFTANLVSNSDEVGVIQKRIIQNLYDNPIVVCDVSGKNPNVMFELGIRLAFDKPTIIIKDDKTQYSFDTSSIEHLEYPRDLRFSKIVEFKERLTEKILQTHKKATTDENYSTFLKHFGSFKIAQIETEVVSKEDFILEEIKNLREVVIRNNRNSNNRSRFEERTLFQNESLENESEITICFGSEKPSEIEPYLHKITLLKGVEFAKIEKLEEEHCHIEIVINNKVSRRFLVNRINDIVGDKASYVR
jgi:hypothetical protein